MLLICLVPETGAMAFLPAPSHSTAHDSHHSSSGHASHDKKHTKTHDSHEDVVIFHHTSHHSEHDSHEKKAAHHSTSPAIPFATKKKIAKTTFAANPEHEEHEHHHNDHIDPEELEVEESEKEKKYAAEFLQLKRSLSRTSHSGMELFLPHIA